MNLAYLSLAALVIAVGVSFAARLNVGVLAIVFAWLVGVVIGGMSLNDLTAGFPAQLFLILVGVTLLFTQAQANGTLDRIAHFAVRCCRGNVGMIPVMFFFIGLVLATIGPGGLPAAAILAPLAMRVASNAGIPAFLMIIMMANGAQAGTLSPIAPTGIIVANILPKLGIVGLEWPLFLCVLIGHTVVGFAGYFMFGGLRLFTRTYRGQEDASETKFERQHWITVAVIAGLLLAVFVFGVNVGMGAFTGAVILTMLRISGPGDPVKQMPWGAILMVSGVTVLITLVDKTQGLKVLTDFLAQFAGQKTVTGMMGFTTGLISVYSSTSGVVLPAFLPTVPGLAERLGADTIAIIYSICLTAHLVDISPLSTTGAVCIAATPASENHQALFNKLLAWGLSMAVLGAVASYIVFGLLR
jgi:di/tricarboxylate transporter